MRHTLLLAARGIEGLVQAVGTAGFGSLLLEWLSSSERMLCFPRTQLFSAAIHDFRHPANNNNFEIMTLSDRALTYNNKSVLENFHVAEAFKMSQVSDHE